MGTALLKVALYGTRISKRPSKSSTSRAGSPCRQMANPCSRLEVWIMVQPLPRASLQIFSQSRSRTIPERRPTNTPALGSSIHRVSSPRSPTGTRSRIMTTMISLLRCQITEILTPGQAAYLRVAESSRHAASPSKSARGWLLPYFSSPGPTQNPG